MKRFILLGAILLCNWLNVFADQAGPFYLQQYDNRNGLSNSSINKIFTDTDNLLWIGTWDGLNMYDGSFFHVFNYSKDNNRSSIGSNVIQNITEDRRGNIWISTIGGVTRYHKQTGTFYNYFYDRYQQGNVSEQEYTIAKDHFGRIYCLSQKKGLSYYDSASDTFKGSDVLKNDVGGKKIAFDNQNNLWVLRSDGKLSIYSQQHKRGVFKVLTTLQESVGITKFFLINHQILYTTAENKLFSVNVRSLTRKFEVLLPNSIGSVAYYKNHYLFGWRSKGVGVYDSNYRPSPFMNAETSQLKDIKATSISTGTEDILWIGTDGNGIIKIFPKTKSFGTVITSGSGRPYNKSVRAFCREADNLWVGTKGSGLLVYQNFWSRVVSGSQKSSYSITDQLDNNSVYALTKGSDNLIYIGTDAKGIEIYDLKNKSFIRWNTIKGHDAWPSFGSVYAICQDTDQSLWLGTSGDGLIHLKIDKDKNGHFSIAYLEKYTYDNSDNGPANNIIYSLTFGDNNQLWIGCRYGGLSVMNRSTKKFRTFKAFNYDGSLSNNDVLVVFKDSRGRIWIGTSYGLNMLSDDTNLREDPQFKKLTTLSGLPNNTIHAIEEDQNHQIWVSTNKGLAKVNPVTFEIAYYQQSDGLQSNEFCDGASWKDHEGNVYFGGTYGFNSFLPNNIQKNDGQPNLLISGLSLGSKTITGNGLIVLSPIQSKLRSYAIARKDNFFELNIKALSYLNSEKCEYAYFLEGYDKVWHYGGTTGRIIYSNLSPGSYKLKVKWSNGEGGWTKEIAMMELDVHQYPWLTTYAFLAYVLILSTIVFVIYRYRKNKLEMKHQLEVEHLMRTKEDEVHQNRLGFFTNIAHELQTPLTLIMGSAEWLQDNHSQTKNPNEKAYFLTQVYQQSSKLSYLVHQLLEFRKIESGFFENQYSYVNISRLLTNFVDPFIILDEKKKVKSEVQIEPGMLGQVDKDKLEKIIFNLLSNAFKYSEKDEQVKFSATMDHLREHLEIKVANSGVVLPSNHLEQLFDKFYVASNSTLNTDRFGTGIGLAFTRQLVTLMNGSISVTNDHGWICFTVMLPLPRYEGAVIDNKGCRDQPSHLYKIITKQNEAVFVDSSIQSNKSAVIEDLVQDKKNVLIVEDDPEIRYMLKDILKDDYIVFEAEDGQQALDWTAKVLPDIVVCDVMMPNLDGLGLCNKMKNADRTCQIPFILLSAKGSEEQHMEGYEVGADAYIAKPFNTANLKLRIRKLLEYHHRLRELFKNSNLDDIRNEPDMPDSDKEFLARLVQAVNDNMENTELNSALLEKELCLSKMQLYRKLKTLTGMPPSEFIKHLRLKEAATLLRSTNLTVLEIYFRTGFNNQSYFFREFKKKYNSAPGVYRAERPTQD